MRERGSLSKLPEDQFPPSFWPPTSLSLHYLSINLYVHFTNPPTSRPTDGPVFSHSLILLIHLFNHKTDRPIDSSLCYQCHLLSGFWQLPVCISPPPSSPTVRPTDEPTVGPSVGRRGGISHPRVPFMSFTSSQTSNGPTERPNDRPTVSLLVGWNQPSEPF